MVFNSIKYDTIKSMNNQAFIDGQNLKVSTMTATPSWTVDLKRFRIFLSEKYKVAEAYYFIGAYDPRNQDLYGALQKYGYIVVFREHAGSVLSHKKVMLTQILCLL